jgi:hypothetical protein
MKLKLKSRHATIKSKRSPQKKQRHLHFNKRSLSNSKEYYSKSRFDFLQLKAGSSPKRLRIFRKIAPDDNDLTLESLISSSIDALNENDLVDFNFFLGEAESTFGFESVAAEYIRQGYILKRSKSSRRNHHGHGRRGPRFSTLERA